MSQFDIIEALRTLGRPVTRRELFDSLKPDVPERNHPDYLGLTLKRLIQNGKVKYDIRLKQYSLQEI